MWQSSLAVSILAAALSVGCGPGITIGTVGHPTPAMTPRTAGSAFDTGNRRVLVLSPEMLVSFGFGPADPSKPPDLQPGVPHEVTAYIAAYDMVVSAFQRHLLDLGLTPVDSTALLRSLRDPALVARVRARAAQRGDLTLIDLAAEIGPAIGADLALLVRDSRLGYADEPVAIHNGPPGCRVARVQPLQVAVDAVLVRTASGDVVWSGENRTLASDLFAEPVTFPRGPHRARFSRAYGDLRLMGQDDGYDCGTTIFGGLTCVEWGSPSGGCMRHNEPDDLEANAYTIDACVGGLVETLRPLVGAAVTPPSS